MSAGSNYDATNCERGFALLVLLALIGAGATGILLAVNHFVPVLADVDERVRVDLGTVQQAATEAGLRAGAFPVDLDAVATVVGLPATGDWRRDPWDPAQDLDYAVTGSGLRVRSRGPDRQLNTADDVQVQVGNEALLRPRQRGRLRLLRAAFCRELQQQLTAVGAVAPTGAEVCDALRDAAAAQRAWSGADAAQRVVLSGRLTTAASVVAAAKTAVSWVEPIALTGAGGFLERIHADDSRGVDGKGQPLLMHTTLGVIAVGNDGVGGTDDDM